MPGTDQDRDTEQARAESIMASLLPFHRRMVEELVADDGLCVMSAGMGWQKVVAVLLRLQAERRRNPTEKGVVLVLGCNEQQREMLVKEITRQMDRAPLPSADSQAQPPTSEGGELVQRAEEGVAATNCSMEALQQGSQGSDDFRTPPRLQAAVPPKLQEVLGARGLEPGTPADITADTPAAQRSELYRSENAVFVTTRILVVDILSARLQPSQVAGVIVMNAHRVTDSSGEGFALRLFRAGNKRGFVRALSDQPVQFSHGFARAEKVLKALFVRKLFLWPRFEAEVKGVLEKSDSEIEMVELALRQTPAMSAIYEAIAQLMDVCIKELRKSNKIDSSELTLEGGLFKSFDDIVRRQLDAVWHTVSPRTKQIVADLRTLRTLAEQLLHFDAVTFLEYLDALRVTEGAGAHWLFHDAAHTIFDQAKRRVFVVRGLPRPSKRVRDGVPDGSQEGAAQTFVEPVLEVPPKWEVLLEILKEVQTERERLLFTEHADQSATQMAVQAAMAPVLVVAKEARSCKQLRQCLEAGGAHMLMQQLYEEYLEHRLEVRRRVPGRPGRGSGRGRHLRPAERLEAIRAQRLAGNPKEEEALLGEARAVATAKAAGKAVAPDGDEAARGRARGRGRGRRGRAARGRTGRPAMASSVESPPPDAPDPPGEGNEGALCSELLQGVRFHSLETRDESILFDVEPAFVLMYDPDIAFVRQLEVFKSERRGWPLRVYHLRYEESLESDKFSAALVRERRVFEELIRSKGHMVLPDLQQELTALARPGKASLLHPDVVEALPGSAHNALTRRAGGRLSNRPVPRRVVVDMREFMSSLPAVLHQQGMQITPVTLEVGDYVLSPEICVERKSITDLRSSMQSGRLYHQAEAMSRHYRLPVLLIEFDRDKAFLLHSPQDIGPDIQANSLSSKLVLLTLHFPRLRIIWSRSLHATCDIFASLKSNQDEPDPMQAAAVGVPAENEAAGGASVDTVVNSAAVDLLRRLPGVTEANLRALMNAAGSLAGLAELPLASLESIMGPHNSKKLREWLDAVCPRMA